MATLKEKREFYNLLKSGELAEMIKDSVKQGTVGNAEEVYNVVKPLAAQEPDVEKFWVLFLNSRNKILEISMMFSGSIMAASVYPRELIKKILATRAASIVCCHNHPSGCPKPSTEDINMTFQIVIALRSIGVTLHDHIIIGDGSFYSMADHDIMPNLNDKYERLIRS